MDMTPDARALAEYEATGYLSPIPLLDADQVLQARACFDALEAAEGVERSVIGLRGRHFDQRFIWDLATHPRLLDWIELLAGPDLLLLSTHVFCKYPGGSDGHFVAWHQDVTYWGLAPPQAFTAWIAIDDSDTGNGCMEVVPGTHRNGVMAHGKASRSNNLLASNQAIAAETLDADKIVPLVLEAGQFSLHDGALVHGSRPNTSTRRRCGLTVRFVRPEVKQVKDNNTDGRWKALSVRGRDPYQNFGVTPAPFPQAQSVEALFADAPVPAARSPRAGNQ